MRQWTLWTWRMTLRALSMSEGQFSQYHCNFVSIYRFIKLLQIHKHLHYFCGNFAEIDHPHGYVAKPVSASDGSINMMEWKCLIPGKENTEWAGAYYPVKISFTNEYPAKAPKVELPAAFFHPNIYPSGKVCLSILDDAKGWKPSITIRQILVGVQELLTCPNEKDPANGEANSLFIQNSAEYKR